MTQILGYWCLVTIQTVLLLFPVYWFSVMVLSKYAYRVYQRADIGKMDVEEWLRRIFLKPLQPWHDRTYNSSPHAWERENWWHCMQFAWLWLPGAFIWVFLSIVVFLIPGGERFSVSGSMYATYGYYGSIVHCVAVISEFLSRYISTPLLVVVVLLIIEQVLPALLRKAARIMTVINKLEKEVEK